jgi:hypothetical protein
VGRHRHVVRWSDELHEVFGLTPGDTNLTYESYLDHGVHPQDRELVAATVQRAAETATLSRSTAASCRRTALEVTLLASEGPEHFNPRVTLRSCVSASGRRGPPRGGRGPRRAGPS